MGNTIWQCQGCKAVKYCNKRCQKQQWSEHKKLCCAIQDLSKAEENINSGHFMSHLTPKQHTIINNLVGNHCTVNCQFGGKTAQALWDTGAQVSLASKQFLREMFSDTEIKDFSELIEAELNITAANGEAIPYAGWVQLNFQLSQGQPLLQVPFLVTEKHLNLPLIGYNVIEHCVKSNNLSPHAMNSVFNNVPAKGIEALVEFIQAAGKEQLGIAKSSKKDYMIPKGNEHIMSGESWPYCKSYTCYI